MENNINYISTGIVIKLLNIILILFVGFGTYVILSNEGISAIILIFIFLESFLLITFYLINVNYSFDGNKINVKYPFKKSCEYFTDDIIGCISSQSSIKIYTHHKNFELLILNKRMQSFAEDIIKTIGEKIFNNGEDYIVKNNIIGRRLIYKTIVNRDGIQWKNKIYKWDNILIENQYYIGPVIWMKLVANDGTVIKINSNMFNGIVGIFSHINKQCAKLN